MQATCRISGASYDISDREWEFANEIAMPLPDLSPAERLRQLMASRNEWKLYHRTCDATGAKILSAYPPDSPYKVYRNDIWWGDSWEALDYGKPFDFNRSFFEQFHELQLAVPREGTSVFQSENCDYNSHTRQAKNCYLNSLVAKAENLLYSYWMANVEDIVDSAFHISGKSSLCYECLDFSNCFNGVCLQEVYNSSDCCFSYQLRGCDHCIFCSNLANKSYQIRNKPCSKEEYENLRATLMSGSYKNWSEGYRTFIDVRMKAIHRSTQTMNCENVIGDHLFDSRNCFNCFDGDSSEDCTNDVSLNNSKDIHSCHSAGWPRCERLWNCSVSRGCTDMAFTRYMWSSTDMRYCDSCQTCKHCIGCIGLRHKDYCILNKQYTKEEYEKLAPKVIEHMKNTGEWGTFWPYSILPFAYNESAAAQYFPLTKEDTTARGFLWRDVPEKAPEAAKVIKAKDLPDSIVDIPDDVLHWAIKCEVTDRPFKITKQELEFYRRMGLPFPRLHPEERHRRRMSLRNPYHFWSRTCGKCAKPIESTYSPERPEKVFCEECYLKEVY